MAGEILWFNDLDSREVGFHVTPGLRGIMGATPRSISIETVIGKHGGVFGAEGFHEPRRPRIPGLFVASSIEDLNADWALVQQQLLARQVRLRHTYAPDLEYLAKWINEEATFEALALEPEQDVVLEFLCANPFGRHIADSPFTVNFDDTPTPVPCGLMPCIGTFIITGTNPIVTLYDSDGVPVETMGFTATHGVDQQTEIESHKHRVMFNDDGDLTSARASLTSGQFIVVDALKYGDYAAEEWPMLSINNGDGTFIYDKYS